MKSNKTAFRVIFGLIAGTVLVLAAPKSGARELRQAGTVKLSLCSAPADPEDRNPFVEDKCTPLKVKVKSCIVNINAVSGKITVTAPALGLIRNAGRTQYTTTFADRPYQYSSGWYLTNTKPFTRNITGNVQVEYDSGRAMKVELYVNHNRQGSSYTRVRCSALN